MPFLPIDDAYHELVEAVKSLTKPGGAPIPITIVSVTDSPQGQLIVFDGQKWPKDEIVKRLRLAGDFLDGQPPR